MATPAICSEWDTWNWVAALAPEDIPDMVIVDGSMFSGSVKLQNNEFITFVLP